MITKKELTGMMRTQTEIALATSVNGQPHVRIVNFYFDATANTLFFTTFGDNDKVKEFEANPQVAFTTIPHHGYEHVKANGIVKKSDRTIFDVADGFTSKIPDYQDTIEQAGEQLVLYEIKFDTAVVTLDFEHMDTICLEG
ncbi:pyridoxamine 5'-phosphate oxidase family protein [Anoxynatronum sibiricum]|uniref:Pyridoxamine 5'-phosphate oxidase family protein n=1 Tax=Anoxynatronum sibiricum TaxID=210623 RepID=A0ABU9VR80_9CLOT